MATEVKRRRGTTDQHNGTNGEVGFTGAVGELTVDLDKDTVVVHDGESLGGFPLLREDLSNVPTTAPFTHITLDTAIFDTAYTETESETQGTLYWNQDEETLSLVTNGSTLELGHKTELHVKVTQTGGVSRGDVVAATGAVGGSGKIEVQKFSAGTSPTKTIVGVMDEDVAQGEFGKAIAFGKIRGLNMSAFSEGDILYASTTAGELTGTEPATGNVSLPIAYVVDNSVNTGEIFVRVTPIDENAYQDYDAGLADIAGLTPTDSTIIVGNGTNWVGESGNTARLSLGVGSTDSPTFGGLTVNGNITVTGNVDGRDVSADGTNLDTILATGVQDLASTEVDQLKNIDSVTISNTQWGYLGELDQSLTQASDVTFNVLSISDSITDASTTYVPGITGVGTIYDMDNGNGSFFEVDNMRVRNEMRVHIFKKDIVKASNAYLFITDSAEVAKTTTITDNTGTFRVVDDGTNASFEHGDLLWAKNLQDNGTLQAEGVKIEVSAQPKYVWDNSTQVWDAVDSIAFSGYADEFASGTDEDSGKPYVEYNVYAVEDGGTLNAGDTIVRVSGGSILNDASSAQSPFIDIYDGVNTWADFQNVDKTKVRLGNLAAVSNASGYGLYTQNAFLTGDLVVGDLTKAGNYLEYSGGNLSGVFNDIDFDSNTFSLQTTNLRIDSQDEIIQIGSGNWVELGDLGSTEYGLSLNTNNYWKYNGLTGAYFFKVGGASNFISFNTATGTLNIETDEFSLTAGEMSIDSTNGVTIDGTNFFKQDKTFSFGGGLLSGNGTTLSISGSGASINVTNFELTTDDIRIDSSFARANSNITSSVTYGDALDFSGIFFDSDNYLGHITDPDDSGNDGYLFRVGGTTSNFLEVNEAGGIAKIVFDTFDLSAGGLAIDSSLDKKIIISDATEEIIAIGDFDFGAEVEDLTTESQTSSSSSATATDATVTITSNSIDTGYGDTNTSIAENGVICQGEKTYDLAGKWVRIQFNWSATEANSTVGDVAVSYTIRYPVGGIVQELGRPANDSADSGSVDTGYFYVPENASTANQQILVRAEGPSGGLISGVFHGKVTVSNIVVTTVDNEYTYTDIGNDGFRVYNSGGRNKLDFSDGKAEGTFETLSIGSWDFVLDADGNLELKYDGTLVQQFTKP